MAELVSSDAAFELTKQSWSWLEDELAFALEGELSSDQVDAVRAAFQVARLRTFAELVGAWSELRP